MPSSEIGRISVLCFGPNTNMSAGTSSATSAFAPIMARSPMVTGPSALALSRNHTSSPTIGMPGRLGLPAPPMPEWRRSLHRTPMRSWPPKATPLGCGSTRPGWTTAALCSSLPNSTMFMK